jgi:hypothetical protein
LQRFQARYLRELGREYADLAAVHAANRRSRSPAGRSAARRPVTAPTPPRF